ncbi:ribosomal RNA processing protein 1 homolog A-like [Patiria miniata]|uniref:Uncharacterized protein n=1 Tax=Patiria miniata TaxID=46514 RepID=A0A914ANG6_PATMI|nr:ribosomal RNA processing protein 1 homolog A-like [Patiria miniata]
MATTMEENFKFGLDIHFAQRLAGNVTKIRERTVKKLKRWIAARSLKQGDVGMESELMRLWKGLFYCMWMCDKPVIQEEMADKIAELVHSFTTPKGAMAFFDAFLLTMKREWIGIDRLRMDKFFMFVRRCLRQVLVVLRNNNWEDSIVEQFLAVLCKTPLSADPEASPDGLRYHFIDIYKEELARCAGQELTPSVQVMKLIDPFCVLVTTTRNKTLLKVILRGFFQEIIDESDVGFRDESEDEGIDSGEEEKEEGDKDEGDKEQEENEENLEEEDNEEEEKKKKYVRKERPKLKYDYEAIAERLFTLASQQSTPGFVRRKVYTMVKKFRDLKEGVFPDYNVGSLMDYQDDDDETEQKYGDRPPPEKQKKPRRRGGKQVRERRLAKAQIETAREARQTGKRFADDSDEEELMDEEAEEKEEDQKKKKRRRRKKKLKKVDGETEEATTTGAAGEKEKSSETEDGKKEPEEGDESSKQEEIVEKEPIVEEKKAVEEIIVTAAKPSPGTDEPDGGTKKKRGRKRKSEASQNEVAVPVLDHGDALKESETADNEETKTDATAMETAVATETASPSAGSETKSNRKQKGKQGKRKSNVGGVERGEASNLGDSVDAAHKSDAVQSKEEIIPPKDEVQINLFPVSELSKDSATTKDTSLQLSTGSSQKLSAGGKQKTEQPFAAFQTVSTPPALVRRKVVRKAGEPKTEPPRKTKSRLSGLSDDTDSDQPTPRKRVKIALGLNKAHASKDYKKQLESSPGIPFDGSKKPTQSVLKTPSPKPRPPTKKKTATPTFKTPSPKIIKEAGVKSSSKKRRSPKTTPNLRRSSRLKPTHK